MLAPFFNKMSFMFIGREYELLMLNKFYESDRLEFVIIYGHSCIGKTAVISVFIESKKRGRKIRLIHSVFSLF